MVDSDVRIEHLGGDRWVISPVGEHDVSTAPDLRLALDQVFATGTRIVVDLSGTTFVDSTILSTLVEAQKRARNNGGEQVVVVAPDGGFPARVLDLAGVRPLLVVHADTASALHGIEQE